MNEIIKKNAIKYGIINIIITILITVGIYVVDYKMFGSNLIGIFSISIAIGLSIFLFVNTKKQMSGQLSFKEGFSTYFLYTLIAIIGATAFNILLYNVIDPELKEKVTEVVVEKTVEMMKGFGADNATMKEALKGLKEKDQFSVSSQALGSVWTLIISCVWGVILALIFKTKSNSPFNE
jgi:hypothetical protein